MRHTCNACLSRKILPLWHFKSLWNRNISNLKTLCLSQYPCEHYFSAYTFLPFCDLQGSKSVKMLIYLPLKCQTLSNLTCVHLRVKMSWPFLSCIVQCGQNDRKTSQKCPCVHIWVNSQNSQLTDFDHYSYMYKYLPLKFSCSRRVKGAVSSWSKGAWNQSANFRF